MANNINSTDVNVYNEFLTLATRVFNIAMQNENARKSYIADGGSMTASELVKWSGFPVVFDDDALVCALGLDNDEDGSLATVAADNFKCSFRPSDVFALMDYFARLAHAGKHTFLAAEDHGEPVHACTLNLGDARTLKRLTQFVSKDTFSPAMRNICLEEYNGFSDIAIVATNGHKVAVVKSFADIHADGLQLSGQYFFTADQWKIICTHAAANGNQVHVSFYAETDEYDVKHDFCVVDLADRQVRSVSMNCRFPNWRAVVPSDAEYLYFSLDKANSKTLADFAKRVRKINGKDANLIISLYEGSDVAWLDSDDASLSQAIQLDRKTDKTEFHCFPAEKWLDAPVNAFTFTHDGWGLLQTPLSDVLLITCNLFDTRRVQGITIPQLFPDETILRIPGMKLETSEEDCALVGSAASEEAVFSFRPMLPALPAPAATLALPAPVQAELLPVSVATTIALPVPVTKPVSTPAVEKAPVAPRVPAGSASVKEKKPRRAASAKVCLWAKLNTPFGDRINVRIEAINEQERTATIRTKGWNRYSVSLSLLTPTVEEGFTLPSWMKVGQCVCSNEYSGIITEAGRTYVILDHDRQYTHLDLMLHFFPQEEAIGELDYEDSLNDIASGGFPVMPLMPTRVAAAAF